MTCRERFAEYLRGLSVSLAPGEAEAAELDYAAGYEAGWADAQEAKS